VSKDRGGFLLVENHCPICAAARVCQGFCRSELELFREVLGPGVEVERTEHVLAGGRRCAYRVTSRPAAAGARRS
jgi:predicted ArsR family transcriptional regulator